MSKPLLGRRVIITRSEVFASEFREAVEKLGAQVELCPVIKTEPPPDCEPVDSAIARLAEFDWIIFTSVNGVNWFIMQLPDIRAIAGPKLAAIGPKTAETLRHNHLKVDYVPSRFVSESVVEEFPEDLSGKSVLIPCALEARDAIIRGLEAKGARVEAVPVYETVVATGSGPRLRELAAEGAMDIITFTSPSTVKNFLALLGDVPVPESAIIACIGPITADAAREHGLKPDIIAEEFTTQGLVDAIIREVTARGPKSQF